MGKQYPYCKNHSFLNLLLASAFILLTGTSFAQVTRTWNGGGGDSFWTNRLNWGGTAPVSGNLLLFEGSAGLSPINTFTSGTTFNGLSFGTTAGAFTLSGYPFTVNGSMTNSSAQNQVINNNIILPAAFTVGSTGGDLTLNGVISGAFNFTKNGSGLVRLGGQNTFTGNVTISDGTLRLAGSGSTLASRNIVILSGGALDVGTTTQLVDNFSGTGGALKGTGHLIANLGTTNYSFAGSIGDNDSLNFTKTGENDKTLTLTNDNTTKGIVTVHGGNPISFTGLWLSGAGKFSQLSRLNLAYAAIRIDNSTATADRFKDSAPIYINGGGFNYIGSSTASSDETFGALNLVSGQTNLSVSNPSGSYSTRVNFAGFNRTKGAIVNLNRQGNINDLGRSGNFYRIYASSTPGALGGIIPETVNGVVPGVFGSERDLVGYVDSLGFGRLGTTGFPTFVQYNTNTTLDGSVNATTNILVASTSVDTLTIPSGGANVNAISLRRNNLEFTNPDDVLDLTAGVLMSMGHGEGRQIGSIGTPGVLTTPRSELFLISWHNSGGNMTINSKIIGNTMVVCGGDGSGSINFTFTNTGNSYTGGTVLNGNSGGAASLTLNNATGAVMIPNASNPDSGLIINDNAQVAMSVSQGQIGSSNKVTLNGLASMILFGNNTLAGLNFNVYAAPTVNCGTSLTLTGGINVTHSNPSYTATINTGTLNLNGDNSFPIYVDGLPSGDPMNFKTVNAAGLTISNIVSNGGITKTGSGVLALTNASNSFTGPITITAGSVRLNYGGNVTSSSSVVLNGGNLNTFSIAASRVVNFNGGLVLNQNGSIELFNVAHTLNFGNCSSLTWGAGKTIVVKGWTGRAGISGTGGKVFFGTGSSGLTATQLGQISFEGFTGGAMLLSTGELVPAATGPYEPMIDRIVAGNGSATVSFFSPNNRGSAITNYEYSIDNGLNWTTLSPAVTASPFTITGLTNGINYHIRIRAVNANGVGTMSNPESIIPSTGLSRVTYAATALNVTSSGTGSEILSTGNFIEANRFGNGALSSVTLANGITFGNSTASMIRPDGPNFQSVWEWSTTSVQTYQTGWGHNSSNSRVSARGWGLTSGSAMHSLMTSAWWMNYSGSRSDLIIPGLTPGNIYRLQLISEAPSDASVYVEDGSSYTWSGTNPSVLSMTWVARDNEMFMRLSRKVTDRVTGTGQGGEVFFNGYVLQAIGVAGTDTTVTACGSFTWNDSTYTASTNTSKSFTRTGQLDSVAYLNLTIIPITSNTTTASACDSYTWSVNGTTYTQSGTYSSVSGCHTEILNLTITASTSNTTTVSACGAYTWSVNGTTYTQSGSYTSVAGCHTEYLNLTILTVPTAVITNNTASTQLTCARTSISLTASGGDTYLWSGGLGSDANASVTSPSTYTVTVTDANGCTDTETITITQDITTPNAVITPGGSTTLCIGSSVSLTASGGSSYLWGDGSTSALISANTTGNYSVVVTANNGCTSSASIAVTVDDAIAPTVSCVGLPVPVANYNNLAPGGGTAANDKNFANISRWAQQFTASASGSVSNIKLNLYKTSAFNGTSAAYDVQIWSGSGTTPTALLATLKTLNWDDVPLNNTTTNTSAFVEISSFNTSYDLVAGTTYWLVVSQSANGPANKKWSITGSGKQTASFHAVNNVWTNTGTTANLGAQVTVADPIRMTNAQACTYTAVGTEFDPLSSSDNCGVTSTTYSLSGATTGTGNNSLAGVAFNKGVTTVTWTVADAFSNTNSCSFTVTVNDKEVPVITLVGSSTVNLCRGESYSDAGATATDNCDVNPTANIVVTGSVNTAVAGSYTLSYNLTDAASNTATTVTRTVVVNALPNTVITNNTGSTQLTCARTAINLTASGGTSYVWSGGLGSNATATVTSPSTYTVTATDSNGCTATASITITQDITTPTAVITNNTGNTELTCSRTAISLTASGAVSYAWSGGLGSNAAASVTSPGTFTVTATAANGCTDTESISISQDIAAATPVITAGGVTSFCDGGQVQLTSSGATSYSWSSGANTASIQVSASGSYAVTVTYSNGCTAVSAATSVTVIPNTSNASQVTDCESYTWTVNGTTYTQNGIYTNVSVCHTETLDLNLEKPRFSQHPSTMSQKSTAGIVLPAYSVAVTGGSGHTFQWYSNTIQSNAGGTLIPGAQSTTYQPSTQSVGTTYYYVKTTTSNGCQSTSNPSGFIEVCGQ